VGRLGKAPGTMGSLAAFPVIFAFSYLPPFVYMALTVVLVILSIVAADQYGEGQDLKEIVADEFVGLMVALFLVPQSWILWPLTFLLFRFFDIFKPFPISHLDKNVKGGFGVVLDDLVAGLFANAYVHFLFIPYVFSLIPVKEIVH
jgi:phosphatidylglycerophosphatase A